MPIERSNREVIKIQTIYEFWKQIFSLKTFIGRRFEVGVAKTLPGAGTAKKRIVDKQKTKEIERVIKDVFIVHRGVR